MSDLLRIILVFLLVLGNAVFVAAEYALVTARRSRLEQHDSLPARRALRLMDEPVRFISTVQVGITVFSIMLGAVGEPLLSDYFDPVLSHTLAFLILTYLSVVLGELVPKAIALQRAEALASALATPLDWLGRVAHPLVWLLAPRRAPLSRRERDHARAHGFPRFHSSPKSSAESSSCCP